jgi:hypothetical protein
MNSDLLRPACETRASAHEDNSVRAPALLLTSLALSLIVACGRGSSTGLSSKDSSAIAAEIERRVKTAYDLEGSNVEQRMLDLYAPTGRIVSAATGLVVTNRDTIEGGVRYFWRQVGSNMRNPKWIWDKMVVDVLAPNAAVMTASYHIPHLTPRGEAHVLGGAWTAVFEKRAGQWVIVQEHLSDLPQQPAAADTSQAAHQHMPGMSMPQARDSIRR